MSLYGVIERYTFLSYVDLLGREIGIQSIVNMYRLCGAFLLNMNGVIYMQMGRIVGVEFFVRFLELLLWKEVQGDVIGAGRGVGRRGYVIILIFVLK